MTRLFTQAPGGPGATRFAASGKRTTAVASTNRAVPSHPGHAPARSLVRLALFNWAYLTIAAAGLVVLVQAAWTVLGG